MLNYTLTVEQRKQYYLNMIARAEKMMKESFNNDNDQMFWYQEKAFYEGLLNGLKGA